MELFLKLCLILKNEVVQLFIISLLNGFVVKVNLLVEHAHDVRFVGGLSLSLWTVSFYHCLCLFLVSFANQRRYDRPGFVKNFAFFVSHVSKRMRLRLFASFVELLLKLDGVGFHFLGEISSGFFERLSSVSEALDVYLESGKFCLARFSWTLPFGRLVYRLLFFGLFGLRLRLFDVFFLGLIPCYRCKQK